MKSATTLLMTKPTCRRYLLLLLILAVLLSVTTPTPTQGAPLAQSPGLQTGQPIYLHLALQSFDPLTLDPTAQFPSGLRRESYAGDGSGYYIIQFSDIAYQELRARLEALGVRFHSYLPDLAFIVRMNAAIAEVARSLPGVRWVGLYQPSYRIDPDLLMNYVSLGSIGPIQMIVSTFPGEDIQPIVQQLESWGGQVLAAAPGDQWEGRIQVQISAVRISDIANLQPVEWVEQFLEMVLHNNVAADIIGVRPVWNNHGLYGSNQVVGICDSGLDRGSILPANLHNDFENGAGASRVITITDIASDGVRADLYSGHGTHVAGSVLGSGLMSGSLPLLHNYPTTSPVGMAPEARLYFQACGTTDDGIRVPLPISNLFNPAYAAGARVHTNSWGSEVASSYDSVSQSVDQFMWDTRDMTVLFSAGNAGVDANANGVIDLYSIGRPATAKNNITVGASESVRPPWPGGGIGYDYNWAVGSWAAKYPVAPISTDHMSNNSMGMAAFSSRGPTQDGRIKPDIVGPGTNILSVRSYSETTGLWGELNADYAWSGGTSMSAPIVAGAAVLAREFFTRTHTFEASSALIKATLINGATEMAPGQYGTGATREITPTRPNPQEGWGRVNLEASLFPAAPRRTLYWDTSRVYTSSLNSLSTGRVATYTFQVTQSLPLSITLAWTDYPGTLASNGTLINDLDLQVTGPTGATFYPNNANHRGPTQHLLYDDWSGSWQVETLANQRRGVCFTPSSSSYPITVDKGLFLVDSATYPRTFNYYIYTGSCAGANPGTLAATGTTTIRQGGWHVVDLSSHGISIPSGDFSLVIDAAAYDFAYGRDNTAPISGRSWVYNAGTWSKSGTYDHMLHAIVKGADYSTQADRVNNVEGIDIASPATGVYTITVSGYNVPYGPQPYALVLSGVGRPLGSETLTRTIPGTGTYKFGNTGATLRFTSENLNEVSATVYRDKFPTTLPADQALGIKRYYVITSTGGTGAFNADLALSYEQDEVGAVDESNLSLYRWLGTGLGWQAYPATVDANANVITATGVTAFSYWAIAEPAGPTSVTLTGAAAQTHHLGSLGWLVAFGMVGIVILAQLIRRKYAR